MKVNIMDVAIAIFEQMLGAEVVTTWDPPIETMEVPA